MTTPARPSPEPSQRLSALERAVTELTERLAQLEPNGSCPEPSPALAQRLQHRPEEPQCHPAQCGGEGLTLLVFSADLDKLLAALVIATGAAASGLSVTMFFAFWGIGVLRRANVTVKKSLVERAFGFVLPKGTNQLPLSRLHLGGAGATLMRSVMKKKGVPSPEELLTLAGELGVDVRVCTMSMDLLGIRREELIDYPRMELCGVASFVELASRSRLSMFI